MKIKKKINTEVQGVAGPAASFISCSILKKSEQFPEIFHSKLNKKCSIFNVLFFENLKQKEKNPGSSLAQLHIL